MFADYRLFVIHSYREKKADGTLPLRLSEPTPANVKRECLAVCDERFNRKDEGTLRTFFGQSEGKEGYLKAIRRCETDKFRPLVKFLKDLKIDTDDKNIELLAWLIELIDRPFDPYKDYTIENPEKQGHDNGKEPPIGSDGQIPKIPKQPGDDGKGDDENFTNNPIPAIAVTKFRTRIIILLLIVLTSLGAIVYLTNQEKCMYWAGDHYEPVSCSQKFIDTLIVASDPGKLNRFRKITNWSTITNSSIGKVWYVKVDGKIEFYTSDGYHPIELQLRLRPITPYIINKYIHQ